MIRGWQNISVSYTNITNTYDMRIILKMRYWRYILYNWTEYSDKANNIIGSVWVFRFIWESNVNGKSTVYIGSQNRDKKKTVALCEKNKYIAFYVIHIILMDISCTVWYVYSIIITYISDISQNKRCCRYSTILYDISISRIDLLFVQRRLISYKRHNLIYQRFTFNIFL